MENKMGLINNKKLFKELIEATAKNLNISPLYVEKDFWVCCMLEAIFSSEIGKEVVFKGGTALAKCHGVVNRFSEDIDIVILRDGTENDNQLKRKIKKVSKAAERIVPETEDAIITHKRGTIRKTAHNYPKVFTGSFGQVRDLLILEVTWLGNFEPYKELPVSSYVSDFLMRSGKAEMVKQFGLEPFTVKVLTKERTTCEKIMSLVRFSNQADPITDLSNKIRHVYDLHYLLCDQSVSDFFNSPAFAKMLNEVGSEDKLSFKNNNKWISRHPAHALLFREIEQTWQQIRKSYLGDFSRLVPFALPPEEKILSTLNQIATRLNQIEWEHEA